MSEAIADAPAGTVRTAPSPDAVGPGTDLGPYRLVDRLGEGGMGEVFLAEHRQLGRRVALKVLRSSLAGNPDQVRRFFQEARVVNRIAHEHLVQIQDFFEGPPPHFIMELLIGKDLARARADDGPFPVARTTVIARQILEGLSAVHEKHVIHRDLKPENVFLTRLMGGDFVKLLDFGVAKLGQTLPGAPPGALTAPAPTMAGAIVGTPDFMSPEQAGGRPIDARSDLYAFGLILYWMLADRVPNQGHSFGELVALRETQPPPPLPPKTCSGEPMPQDLADVALACLSRDPGARPRSARAILESLSSPAPLLLSRRSRRSSIPVVLAGALALAAAAWWLGRESGREAPGAKPAPSPTATTPDVTAAPVPAVKPRPLAALPEPIATSTSETARAPVGLASPQRPPAAGARRKSRPGRGAPDLVDPFAQ